MDNNMGNNARWKELVGTILLGPKVQVSDPCYEMDIWCAETLDNVRPGKYTCFVEYYDDPMWGKRVSAIECKYDGPRQEGVRTNSYYTLLQDATIGVDSGQCGIFDYAYSKGKHEMSDMHDSEWYESVCNLTHGALGFRGNTIDERGLVASSGYGDGCYPLYVCYNSLGEVVKIKVKFIWAE